MIAVADDGSVLELLDVVPAGHKIARRLMKAGAPVRRYGEVIGFAGADIARGRHVHMHNLLERMDPSLDEQRYAAGSGVVPVDFYPPEEMRYFEGYKRADGRVGTRNYIAVISTVNCSASVSQMVRERFRHVERDYPGVDGVIALTHKSGCGQVQGAEDHRALERVLAGYARHPNVAAYVVIGLGCEVNQAPALVERHRLSLMMEPKEKLVLQGAWDEKQ